MIQPGKTLMMLLQLWFLRKQTLKIYKMTIGQCPQDQLSNQGMLTSFQGLIVILRGSQLCCLSHLSCFMKCSTFVPEWCHQSISLWGSENSWWGRRRSSIAVLMSSRQKSQLIASDLLLIEARKWIPCTTNLYLPNKLSLYKGCPGERQFWTR